MIKKTSLITIEQIVHLKLIANVVKYIFITNNYCDNNIKIGLDKKGHRISDKV